ncbi:hypothetical protein MRX96_036003 [Rhipicephalus microplus]
MHAALSLDTDDFEGVHSTSSRTPLLRTRAQSDQTSCFMDMAEQQPNISNGQQEGPPQTCGDLLLTKACWQRHAINASACRNLSWNVTIKDDVTRYANLHNLVLFLIQFVPAGLLSIFVSPWSDRYGHKIPLLVATSGGILQDLTTLFSVMYTSVPLYATVLCAIPNGFSGGLVSVCASVYSNGTRTATAELKTVRFACIMTALTLGFQLGLFVGGQVFRAAGGNYTAIYVTSAILLALMFVWIGWTVPFSNQLHRTSRRELVRDLIRTGQPT